MSAIIIPNARIARGENASGILVEIPGMFQVHVAEMVTRCWAKHNGYARVSIATPSKPRTTGKGSQSAHLHGHLSQLAVHFGYDMAEMKDAMKHYVPEWPVVEERIGKRVRVRPESESLVDTVVESKAIDWTHLIAAEEGITLIEGAI